MLFLMIMVVWGLLRSRKLRYTPRGVVVSQFDDVAASVYLAKWRRKAAPTSD